MNGTPEAGVVVESEPDPTSDAVSAAEDPVRVAVIGTTAPPSIAEALEGLTLRVITGGALNV